MNKNKKKTLIDQEEMLRQANLNNLEPGDSVEEHRSIETANIQIAEDEIGQQNNNL
ncbi:hypothetical protein MUB24_21135 [Lederbergia sp. NSJ-179]|uniref:hypothetical protein n=1 Tax=Lederbergia sp. NSJ-179 TaxID=2931402 RepID=UPI001FD09965|nr:hypothetical protein [Lederbergia sp. NSJ-179]MCJ7843333.1 hypothetical protein [Lederbergia sp. NSJ-179]